LNQDDDEHHIQELISISNNQQLEDSPSPGKASSSFKNKSSNYQYSMSGMGLNAFGSPITSSMAGGKKGQPKQGKSGMQMINQQDDR
jgi:hypothetical protein